MACWNLANLPTNGSSCCDCIGRKLPVPKELRCEECGQVGCEESYGDNHKVELSLGSPSHSTLSLVGPHERLEISKIHCHSGLTPASVMVSGYTDENPRHSCRVLDLEHGGKCTIKYLGHKAGI